MALLELRERELKLTQQFQESESARAAQLKYIQTLTRMLQELQADLKNLFARTGFRWLTKFSSWPEVDKLREQAGKPNE